MTQANVQPSGQATSKIRHIFYMLSAWLAALLYIVSGQFADPDLWGRLSIGALFFQNGRFPYYDVFSYTAPQAPWIDHEWLTGMVFYQLLARFGEVGFVLCKYGMILAIFALLFRLHRKIYQASPLYAFYGLLLLVPVYSIGLLATTRSHLFSFFFFTLFILILERVRLQPDHKRSPKLRWCLPALSVVWANLHGGFIVGILLMGAYGLGQLVQTRDWKSALPCWLPAAAGCILVGLVNPYGLAYWTFLLHAWTLDRRFIAEWHSMNPASNLFPEAQVLVALTLVILLLRWLKADRHKLEVQTALITPTLILGLLTAMTVKSLRFQPFLAWGVIAYLPVILSPEFLRGLLPQAVQAFFSSQASAFRNTLPALVLLAALGGFAFLSRTNDFWHIRLGDELTQDKEIAVRYPLGVINFLRKSPYQGNLAVRFGLGEFAYWALYPRFKVSMDGRYEEVYTQAQFLQNAKFFDKHHPQLNMQNLAAITASPADFILSEPDAPHLGALTQSPHWTLLYADSYFVLLGRKATLARFPVYDPQGFLQTTQTLTIQDFFTPADRARFKN